MKIVKKMVKWKLQIISISRIAILKPKLVSLTFRFFNIYLTKIFNFDQKFDLWLKYRFLTNILIFTKVSIFCKISIFFAKLRFFVKCRVFTEISNFNQYFDFEEDFDFCAKYLILTNISNFDHNFHFWQRFRFFEKMSCIKIYNSSSFWCTSND